ncbi:hypothetical protein, partial [Klebsiella pneumoniae]|uniref:hypothetical protein n=1 Tax=Klebsiella pneumoniae TaxID=573 RepID=UPI001A9C4AF5
MEDLRKRLRFMPEKASFCTGELIRNASSRCVIISAHSREGANKQVISSQADSLIKISRIWADF